MHPAWPEWSAPLPEPSVEPGESHVDGGDRGGSGGRGSDRTGRLSHRDLEHLAHARRLGRRGWGRVHPNPMVGCRIVSDGEVVGEDWHREYGEPHAEVLALRAAGRRALDGTAYVSLEPCAHLGKTPPCVAAILDAGIRRVVYGAADPGKSSGGGGVALREAGVEVVGPVYDADEARRENPGFFHRTSDRPWTVLKLALSVDGALTRRPGVATSLTGSTANERVHRFRAGMDAILVGAGTVRVDHPRLTARAAYAPRVPPARIVLDPGSDWTEGQAASFPGSVLDPGSGPPVRVVVPDHREADRGPTLVAQGFEVMAVESSPPAGGVAPGPLLAAIRAGGVRTLLCEGGARWARAMLEAGVVDRLILVTAPRTFGEGAVSAFPFPEGRWVPAGEPARLGDDLWCEWDREA